MLNVLLFLTRYPLIAFRRDYAPLPTTVTVFEGESHKFSHKSFLGFLVTKLAIIETSLQRKTLAVFRDQNKVDYIRNLVGRGLDCPAMEAIRTPAAVVINKLFGKHAYL
jgi:hypothetical protein